MRLVAYGPGGPSRVETLHRQRARGAARVPFGDLAAVQNHTGWRSAIAAERRRLARIAAISSICPSPIRSERAQPLQRVPAGSRARPPGEGHWNQIAGNVF